MSARQGNALYSHLFRRKGTIRREFIPGFGTFSRAINDRPYKTERPVTCQCIRPFDNSRIPGHCEPVRFPGVAISWINVLLLMDEFQKTVQKNGLYDDRLPGIRGRFPHQFENWFGMTRFLRMRPAVRVARVCSSLLSYISYLISRILYLTIPVPLTPYFYEKGVANPDQRWYNTNVSCMKYGKRGARPSLFLEVFCRGHPDPPGRACRLSPGFSGRHPRRKEHP